MKKLNLIPIAFFLFLNISFSQTNSGWMFSNPQPIGSDFIDYHFINEVTGFALSNGIVLKTTNSGMNWEMHLKMNIPKHMYPKSIFAINSNVIFVGGTFGYLLKYVNKEERLIRTDSISYSENRTIYFINDNTGFIGTLNSLMVTSNGGLHWTKINPSTIKNIFKIKFINSSTGFATSELGKIYKTIDAGLSWTMYRYNTFENIYDIDMVNSVTGYACGSGGMVFKTTDSGLNWNRLSTRFQERVHSINFFDENNGIIISGENDYYKYTMMRKTINGGLSWDSIYHLDKIFLGATEKINDKILLGGNAGYSGQISENKIFSELSNYQIPIGRHIKGMKFINLNTGYLIDETGVIYKTQNRGDNWDRHSTINGINQIYNFEFINENTGFVSIQDNSQTSKFLRTTNSGNNWIVESLFKNNTIHNIYFLNETKGFLTTSNGFFKTVNSGENWILINDSSFVSKELKFFNENVGYCLRVNDIMKTTNGGVSWTKIIQNSMIHIYMSFVNESTGFVGLDDLYNKFLLKTVNGGNSWDVEILTQRIGVMNDIHFTDENTGYIISDKIYRTENSGVNLFSESISENLNLKDSYFYNNDLAFVYNYTKGDLKSPVLLRSTGGIINIGNEVGNVIGYRLFQNYPNPFNPTTTIRFNLSKPQFVTLKVYDIMGREVQTLVNDIKQSGEHRVEFNGGLLSSGVYFYKIISGEFVDVKKMMLIK